MSISTYQVKVDVVGITVICKMHENPRMYNARKNEKKTSKSSILYISLSQIIWTIWWRYSGSYFLHNGPELVFDISPVVKEIIVGNFEKITDTDIHSQSHEVKNTKFMSFYSCYPPVLTIFSIIIRAIYHQHDIVVLAEVAFVSNVNLGWCIATWDPFS